MEEAREAFGGKGTLEASPEGEMYLKHQKELFEKKYQGKQYFRDDELYRFEFDRFESYKGASTLTAAIASCGAEFDAIITTLTSTFGPPIEPLKITNNNYAILQK